MAFLDPGIWPFSWLTTTILILAAVYAILYQSQCRRLHPQEPPIIPSLIPYIGHPLNMLLRGGTYVKNLGIAHRDKPIFTLPVPFSRLYIVTDPSLANAVQRASKALSFTHLVPDVTKRVLGLDAKTVTQIRQNLDPEPGEPRGFLADMHDMVYTYLGPGESLNEFTHDAARELHRQLELYAATLPVNGSLSEPVDLLAWVQHFVTLGTAQFLYGPQNPIAKYPELEGKFWDFDRGLGPLLIDFFPSITAREPYQGREAVVRAFLEYLDAGHHKTGASTFAQRRIDVAGQYGWENGMTARSELSFLFAGITNTAITTFWTVLYIFADRELLKAVRRELEGAITTDATTETAKATLTTADTASNIDPSTNPVNPARSLSISALRNSTPTLAATIREALRVNSDNFSTRLVLTPTHLSSQYFLAQNSIVQIAGGVIHSDASIWGADPEKFDHTRFLRLDELSQKKAGKSGGGGAHPAAFRAFGGGKTLCPGRHFALSEMLVCVGLVVAMFDVWGQDGEALGKEDVPGKEDWVLPVHILEPRGGSPRVRIGKREGAGELSIVA